MHQGLKHQIMFRDLEFVSDLSFGNYLEFGFCDLGFI